MKYKFKPGDLVRFYHSKEGFEIALILEVCCETKYVAYFPKSKYKWFVDKRYFERAARLLDENYLARLNNRGKYEVCS